MKTRLLLVLLGATIATLAPASLLVRAAAQAPVPRAAHAAQPEDLGRLVDEVASEVEKLRGWSFKRPVKRQRTSIEEARRDLRRNIEKALPPDRRDKLGVFLATAGLVPSGYDFSQTVLSLLEQQVAGYYEPETATLHIVDRQGGTPPFIERMILAHELTHALDDQYADLGSLTGKPGERTEDMDIVVTSLAEGSATALMLQHMLRAQAAGRVDAAQLTQYVAQEMERARVFEKLPRYFSAMFGSYVVGAGFLAGGDMGALLSMPDNRVIGDRFLAARRALPKSSEQVLHPQKYWDDAKRDEPVVVDDGAVDKWLASPGWWVVHRDTIGELLTAVLTQPRNAAAGLAVMQTAASWTNPGAAGWGGDRFYLLASGTTREDAERSLKDPRGVWVTVWDTAAERNEFTAALDKGNPPPGYAVSPIGDTGAIVFIGFPKGERDSYLGKVTNLDQLLAARR